MPPSTLTTLTDAVVDVLNTLEFSQAFTAERDYLPRFDLAEMKELRVTVVPKRVVSQAADRSRTQFDYDIDVGIQKKLQSLDNSEIDELVALAEEIADQFRQQRLSAFPSAICLKAEVEPVFAQEHLDQLRQFTSVVTLSFRLWN